MITRRRNVFFFVLLGIIVGVTTNCGGDPARSQIASSYFSPCISSHFQQPFLHWTANGSHLVFGHARSIWITDSEASHLSEIVDANPVGYFAYGFHADVSQDSSRIVYSSCQYEEPNSRQSKPGSLGYEIATIGIDGKDQQRLTENAYFENYPTWSPDGTHIAYVGSFGRVPDIYETRLYVRPSPGMTSENYSGPRIGRVNLSNPPTWSPDSRQVAFVVDTGTFGVQGPKVLYTYNLDGAYAGSNRNTRWLSDTLSAASWSLDGERLAFAARRGDRMSLLTIASDGTDLREVTSMPIRIWGFDALYKRRLVDTLAWSPSGEHILFSCGGGICVAELEGNLVGESKLGSVAAWSPDGSRLAVLNGRYDPFTRTASSGIPLLSVMSYDGSNTRVLIRTVIKEPLNASLVLMDLGETDVDSCSNGVTIRFPTTQTGLVEDCRTLLDVRDALAGASLLNWSSRLPITSWTGVEVGGDPPRVIGIDLAYHRLGIIPPELGRLPEVRTLDFSHSEISGRIPPEIGNLGNLKALYLYNTNLSAQIAPELAMLENLQILALEENSLSGCIAAEFSDLWVVNSDLERCN